MIAEGEGLSLGCLGVTSNGDARRYIVEQADLLLFLGAGFNERTSYLWNDQLLSGKRIVQVDRDPGQLGKVFKPDVAVQGDIGRFVSELSDRMSERGVSRKSLQGFDAHRAQVSGTLAEPVDDSAADPEKFVLIQAFYSALARHFPHKAIVFDDNIVFAQSYYEVSDSNHYFPNSGISSLGHAIPAAIGAKFFAGDSPVFAILGDGGFQMCCMELMTAVNYAVPLNAVVINNATMGLIRKNQFQLYDERYIDCDFVNPDFRALADSFGIHHYRVDHVDDIEALFANADLRNAINLIEITLDKNAFPTYLSSR